MEEHLDSSDKGDRELEVKFFFAKVSRGRSELEELRSLTYAASRYWYNIGKEPFTSTFINASDKIEDYEYEEKLWPNVTIFKFPKCLLTLKP
ncbi:Hypothetical protein FKW44_006419 [Caligus rogercresseyi]|uniref:Uncharacterized protein n=1 Tax=Caligus rogercresseyi TaxID=217165 RepID=A0A7T8KDA5_CALRO|nr:Hypothetical protein FKW44_006419 [Caligus rogercresseyi]